MGSRIGGLIVGVAVLGLMVFTLNDFGMGWDEGYTIECEERIGEWFAWIAGDHSAAARAWGPATSLLEPRSRYLERAGASAGSPWSRESIRFCWPFAREEPTGHPPFFALLGWAGWVVSHRFLPPPGSYRFGAAALFSVTVGVIFSFMSRRYGRSAGAMASLGLVAMPRVFAHAHLASFDVPTLCLWFLAVVAFVHAVEASPRGRVWVVVFGLAWGCAAATKFTGWFLPVPLAAWSLLYRDRAGARTLVLGGLVASVVIYALIPPWWAEPIQGLRVFLESNLSRRQHSAIPTQFLGQVYPFSLPWYNTIVWSAIVVPPAILALAMVGLGRIAVGRLKDRVGVLIFLNWSFFLVLRALPAAPGHDGERQFLPAFAFLACLAGIGLRVVPDLANRWKVPRLASPLSLAVLILGIGSGAASSFRFHPLQMSYYNALIGGLAGAARSGMESTYYWDALTPDARSWLNTHTAPGRSILFAYPVAPFEDLHRWGLLVPSPLPDRDHPPEWYVVQNRPGILKSYPNLKLASYLLKTGKPAYFTASRTAPNVPLVAIYSIEAAAEAEREMESQPSGP